MYVILQLQHSVGDVSNSTSSTVQSLTELVVFFYRLVMHGNSNIEFTVSLQIIVLRYMTPYNSADKY